MKTLITGASGFVGGHLAIAAEAAGDTVTSVSRSGTAPAGHAVACDLLDPLAARRLVAEVQPDAIHHLAALASTGRSWSDPINCLADNQAMTWNLLDAVRAEAPNATVLIACSGESYGKPVSLPIDESHPLSPATPYAVAKTACDLIGGLFAEAHDLKVIRARAFNHAGPGQSHEFLIGSLVGQVAAAVAVGSDSVTLRTGTAGIRRDYTDVRDVVRAYRELTSDGLFGVVNVCSGRSASTEEIVNLVRNAAAGMINVEHVVDPAIVRPHETLEVVGSPELISERLGWEAKIPLDQTVADSLAASLSPDA